ncbi:hypothetical protein ACFB49_46850 [Sphingomonas sp. DBB INV C78]|uniref:hypothetical protein n=1 Tax=Sphingomonas sp. DBB INV C78 TaxID=3349434 RepID=UPI0036D27A40
MPQVDYVLTTFSPAMFGEGATAHIKIIEAEEARSLVDTDTKIVATRVSHDRLAHAQLPGASEETARYAMLKPGVCAIHLHYRGPQVGDDGKLPVGSMVTFYLIEVEEYQVPEAA